MQACTWLRCAACTPRTRTQPKGPNPPLFPLLPHAGGAVRAVKIARKKGPDGKQLPAGFGFVECSSEAAAKVGGPESMQGCRCFSCVGVCGRCSLARQVHPLASGSFRCCWIRGVHAGLPPSYRLQAAVKALQGSPLDGHKLVLQLSLKKPAGAL